MNNRSFSPLLGQETGGVRGVPAALPDDDTTTATLILAFVCAHPACAMVSSLTDVQRCQGTCWGCGRRFANWEAALVLHTSLDAVVQHALAEARAAADTPEGAGED